MSQDSMLDAIEVAIPDLSYARKAFRAALEMARAQLPPELQLVAGPGAAPLGGVRPEDLLVRINPGEPVAPLVGRITSEATWSSGDPAWDAEYAGPGYYARVAPVYGSGVVVVPRHRRVLDYRRRVPAHHVILRPRVVVAPRPIAVRPRPTYRPAPAWPAAPPPPPAAAPMPSYVEPEPDEPTVGAEPSTDYPEPGLDEPIEWEAIAWPGPAAERLDEEPSEVGPGCYEILKAAPGTPPIIYFEFDLSYGASSSSPPPATPDYSLEDDRITTHRKRSHGFRLEGDGNRIELATKEFELTTAGRTDMRATITKVLDTMRDLRRACEGTTAHAGLGYPVDVGAPRHFKPAFAEAGVASIFPLGMTKRSASHPYYRATCAVAAAPQATFEIPLAKVDTLVDIIRKSEKHKEAGNALSAPPGWRQGVRSQALYEAQRAVNASRDEHIRRKNPVSGGRIVSSTTFTPTLQGLLILMVSYLRTGELAYTTDDYEGFAKSYLPINVKNPFRLLFSDLTADEKAVFSALYDSPRAELFALAKPGATAADGGKQLFPARVASHQADFFSRVPTWNDFVEMTVNNIPRLRDVDSPRGKRKGGHELGCELLFAPLSKIMPYERGSRRAALELRRLGFNWVFAGGLKTDGRDRPGWMEMTDMLFDLAVDLNRP